MSNRKDTTSALKDTRLDTSIKSAGRGNFGREKIEDNELSQASFESKQSCVALNKDQSIDEHQQFRYFTSPQNESPSNHQGLTSQVRIGKGENAMTNRLNGEKDEIVQHAAAMNQPSASHNRNSGSLVGESACINIGHDEQSIKNQYKGSLIKLNGSRTKNFSTLMKAPIAINKKLKGNVRFEEDHEDEMNLSMICNMNQENVKDTQSPTSMIGFIPYATDMVPLDKNTFDAKKTHTESLFSEPAWKKHFFDILEGRRKMTSAFDQQVVRIVKGTYHQCPYCYFMTEDEDILRHLSMHATRIHSPETFYKFPECKGKEAIKLQHCFVFGCHMQFYNQKSKQNYRDELRLHLLRMHTPEELKQYNISKPLLKDDQRKSVGKPGRQFFQIEGAQIDYEVLEKIRDNISEEQLPVLNKLAQQIQDKTLVEDDAHEETIEDDHDLSQPQKKKVQFEDHDASVEIRADNEVTEVEDIQDEPKKADALNFSFADQKPVESPIDKTFGQQVQEADSQEHVTQKQEEFIGDELVLFNGDANYKELQNGIQPGEYLYYPYTFLNQYRYCIDEKYFNEVAIVKQDCHGNTWRMIQDYSIQEFDMSAILNQADEAHYSRELTLRELCKMHELDGVQQLRNHGWRAKPGLHYATILEEEGILITDISKQVKLLGTQPDVTRLLCARALYSILVTIENLHQRCNLVIFSLWTKNVYIRKDFQSGYLSCIDAASHDAVVQTQGYPTYKQANGQAMTITDAYIAVLILLVRFSEKEVYKTVNEAMKDQVESGEYTPFEFLSLSITIDQWQAESPLLKAMIVDLVNAHFQDDSLSSDVRDSIRDNVRMLSSSFVVQESDRLMTTYPDSEELTEFVASNQDDHESGEQEQEQEQEPSEPSSTQSAQLNKASKVIKKKKSDTQQHMKTALHRGSKTSPKEQDFKKEAPSDQE